MSKLRDFFEQYWNIPLSEQLLKELDEIEKHKQLWVDLKGEIFEHYMGDLGEVLDIMDRLEKKKDE